MGDMPKHGLDASSEIQLSFHLIPPHAFPYFYGVWWIILYDCWHEELRIFIFLLPITVK